MIGCRIDALTGTETCAWLDRPKLPSGLLAETDSDCDAAVHNDALVIIASYGSVAAAARKLGMSPSTLTLALREPFRLKRATTANLRAAAYREPAGYQLQRAREIARLRMEERERQRMLKESESRIVRMADWRARR